MTAHATLLPAALTEQGLAYDPWRDLYENWPAYEVRIEPMGDDLLGEIREGDIIALRAGTSSGQLRSTLTHEIVHLERGLESCGQWQAREEAAVEAEVARRLLPLELLAAAIRDIGGDTDQARLCAMLDVDHLILQVRIGQLRGSELRTLRRLLGPQRDLWSVA
ncbi:MAG: hypothetical protein QOK10_3011 [Pseudonocardiales bacterium]|jgi:hypothetical protein|nr:hypothetical protein [Pseudonocardiales bacterium]